MLAAPASGWPAAVLVFPDNPARCNLARLQLLNLQALAPSSSSEFGRLVVHGNGPLRC